MFQFSYVTIFPLLKSHSNLLRTARSHFLKTMPWGECQTPSKTCQALLRQESIKGFGRGWYFARPEPEVANDDVVARLLLRHAQVKCAAPTTACINSTLPSVLSHSPYKTLPVPLDMQLPDCEFEACLSCSRLFLDLLHRGKLEKLERVLIAWYWPENSENHRVLLGGGFWGGGGQIKKSQSKDG